MPLTYAGEVRAAHVCENLSVFFVEARDWVFGPNVDGCLKKMHHLGVRTSLGLAHVCGWTAELEFFKRVAGWHILFQSHIPVHRDERRSPGTHLAAGLNLS